MVLKHFLSDYMLKIFRANVIASFLMKDDYIAEGQVEKSMPSGCNNTSNVTECKYSIEIDK